MSEAKGTGGASNGARQPVERKPQSTPEPTATAQASSPITEESMTENTQIKPTEPGRPKSQTGTRVETGSPVHTQPNAKFVTGAWSTKVEVATATTPTEFPFHDQLYLDITRFVLAEVAPLFGYGFTKPTAPLPPDVTASIVATLFIAATRDRQ